MMNSRTTRVTRRIVGGLALGLLLGLGACDSILEVNDPDIVTDAGSAAGAIALRNGVILRFAQATSGGESLFLFGGLLTDEFQSGDTFEQRNSTDQRVVAITNSFLPGQLRTLGRVQNEGQAAINALRKYSPTPSSNIGLMFALMAYAENQTGEGYCNGIPFSELNGNQILFGDGVSYDSAFARAVNHADSALQNLGGTDGPRFGNLAAIVKGRALLNRNQPAAAATAVAAVATSFIYQVTHSENVQRNQIWSLNVSVPRYVVGNNEGGTGLNFVTANDPRVPTKTGGLAFDGIVPRADQLIWLQVDPVTVASGLEARLIEAEAALRTNDITNFLAKLNVARATKAELAPLTDPGTQVARENLLFRERAFWLFATGHRLGDLRRLIRQYGRGAETVFPTGTWFKGGPYGSDVNFPVPFDETNNPKFLQCTDRSA